jgi:hypothetical protein
LHLLPEHRRLQGRLPGFKLHLPAVCRYRGQPGPDIGQRVGVRAPPGDLVQLRLAEVQLSEDRVGDGQVQAVTVFVGKRLDKLLEQRDRWPSLSGRRQGQSLIVCRRRSVVRRLGSSA